MDNAIGTILAIVMLYWFFASVINFWVGIPMVIAVIANDRGWHKGYREAKDKYEPPF